MEIDWGRDEDHTTDGSLEITLRLPKDGKGSLHIRAADRATELKMIPVAVLLSRLITASLQTAMDYSEALELMREHLDEHAGEKGNEPDVPETFDPDPNAVQGG